MRRMLLVFGSLVPVCVSTPAWAAVTIQAGMASFGVDFGCGPGTSPGSASIPETFSSNVFFDSANLTVRPSGSTSNSHGWGTVSWAVSGGASARIAASCASREGFNGALCSPDVGGTGWVYGRGHGEFSLTVTLDQAHAFTSSVSGAVSGIAHGSGVLAAGTHTFAGQSVGNAGGFSLDVSLSRLPCGALSLRADPQTQPASCDLRSELTATLGPEGNCAGQLIVVTANPSRGVSVEPRGGALTDENGMANFQAYATTPGTVTFTATVVNTPAVMGSFAVTFEDTTEASHKIKVLQTDDYCGDGAALNSRSWVDVRGNTFSLECAGGSSPAFLLSYNGRVVGYCPWCCGQNAPVILASGSANGEGLYPCFVSSTWVSYEPSPGDKCLTGDGVRVDARALCGDQKCQGVVDWVKFEFDVASQELRQFHFTHRNNPGGKNPDDTGQSVEKATDFRPTDMTDCPPPPVGEGGIGAGPAPGSTGLMSAYLRPKCDVDYDGDCDDDDRRHALSAAGACTGDASYVFTADADFDGCVTPEDLDVLFVSFHRGDANQDGDLDISDAVFTLLSLFSSRATFNCPDTLDSNDDGELGLSDAVYLLNYLFRDGPEPPSPFPGLGPDPTLDDLDCAVA